MGRKYRLVAFDLGGVLIQIHHTMEGAARQAGVVVTFPISGEAKGPFAGFTPLSGFEPGEAYQKSAITLEEYLARIAALSGCATEEALRVHNAILIDEYPGVLMLIKDIERAGLETGCLSNTNAPHWEELERFPAIARLKHRMASHVVSLSKPDPAIFRLYASTCRVEPEEIVFFDDLRANVLAAARVGFDAVWVDHEGDTAAQMRAALVERGVL